LIKDDILIPLDFSNSDYCIDCIKGKYAKQVKKGEAKLSTGVLEIIHMDICGPFPIKSVDGFNSFITFTDDFSRYGYIYPIKERSESLDKFKILKTEVENQHNIKIKLVRSDHGGESSYPIWPSSWTFCEVLTGKWHSRPVLDVGRSLTEWSGWKMQPYPDGYGEKYAKLLHITD
jgi:hypothetical protein